MVCPNYKKVFYFNNNKSKRKNCSKYKQPFKFTGSGRILSGRSKYNYDGSSYILLIHYSLSLNHDFTEPVFSHTSTAYDSCFPASAPRDFRSIRYSILISCFNKTFCSVKYTVLQRKLWDVAFSFVAHCYKEKSNIWKQIFYNVLCNVFKTNNSKNINLCSGN